MRTHEIVIIATTSATLFACVIVLTLFFHTYFQRILVYKKYNDFLESVNLLETSSLLKILHRLDIISQKNIEYRSKFKTFEREFETLESEINVIKGRVWKKEVPTSSAEVKSLQSIIYSFATKTKKLLTQKKELEVKMYHLLQSDKYLDYEMSLLRIQYKKVQRIYATNQGEYGAANAKIQSFFYNINKTFFNFEQSYRRADWVDCSNSISELKNQLSVLINSINKLPIYNFWLNSFIPEKIQNIETYYKGVQKEVNFAFSYLNVRKLLDKEKKTFRTMLVDYKLLKFSLNFEKNLTTLIKNLQNIKDLITREKESLIFIKGQGEKSLNALEKKIQEVDVIFREIDKKWNHNTDVKNFFYNKIGKTYILWKGNFLLFKNAFVPTKKKILGREDGFFEATKLLKKMLLDFQNLADAQTEIALFVDKQYDMYDYNASIIENIRINYAKLLSLAREEKIDLRPFKLQIKNISNYLFRGDSKISYKNFGHLDVWANEVNNVREEFLNLQTKLEKNIFFKKIMNLLVSESSKYKETRNTNYIRIRQVQRQKDYSLKNLYYVVELMEGYVNKDFN